MNTICAGTSVARGFYLNARRWTLRAVEHDGDTLPGTRQDSYVELPLALIDATAPLMRAGFLAFLPLVGFMEAIEVLARPFTVLFAAVATAFEPGSSARETHLAGRAPEQAPRADAHPAAAAGSATVVHLPDRRAPR